MLRVLKTNVIPLLKIAGKLSGSKLLARELCSIDNYKLYLAQVINSEINDQVPNNYCPRYPVLQVGSAYLIPFPAWDVHQKKHA